MREILRWELATHAYSNSAKSLSVLKKFTCDTGEPTAEADQIHVSNSA